MDIYVSNQPQGLVPLYDSDLENKQRLKMGQVYLVKVSKPRNIKFHKKFFALLRLVFDNLPESIQKQTGINSVDDLLLCLKYELGYCEEVTINGSTFVKTKSISFASMDEVEFEKFFDKCLQVITTTYLGIDEEDILEEIERYK